MLTVASTAQDWSGWVRPAQVAQRLRLIERHRLILTALLIESLNKPRGARHLHANVALHSCIRLVPVGAGP